MKDLGSLRYFWVLKLYSLQKAIFSRNLSTLLIFLSVLVLLILHVSSTFSILLLMVLFCKILPYIALLLTVWSILLSPVRTLQTLFILLVSLLLLLLPFCCFSYYHSLDSCSSYFVVSSRYYHSESFTSIYFFLGAACIL